RNDGGQNLVIEDSTLIGERPCSAGIGFSNFTARRVDISGCADGMKANGNVLVENSHIHDLRKWAGTHNDGIQSTGGSNIVIRNNIIEGANRSSVSAIKLTSENRHLSDVVVQGNRLSGGNYTLYLTNKPGQRPPTDIQIIDNVFVDGTAKWGWRQVDASSSQTWRGNRTSGGNALG
ncbi:MAG: right-handed parallel beta-helix repeat-containing protein, partial [Actinomycetota bacterium]